MLHHFTSERKLFSLSALNSLIVEFPYHYSDAKSKPVLIVFKDNKVNQEGTCVTCTYYVIYWPSNFDCYCNCVS